MRIMREWEIIGPQTAIQFNLVEIMEYVKVDIKLSAVLLLEYRASSARYQRNMNYRALIILV